jgi:hypothetical protein
MYISQALELADQSIDSLIASLEGLSIEELHTLVKDLRFINRLDIFTACHGFLLKKAQRFLNSMKELENHALDDYGLDELRDHILEKTGFKIDSKTLPAQGVEKLLDEIARLRR